MHRNVVELVRQLAPPPEPRYNRGDWGQVEAEVGTRLPADFKDFIETYGAVVICDMLWLITPFYYIGESAYVPLLGEKKTYRELLLSCLREMDAVVGGRDNVPWPDYPERGGLLPIGGTQDAGMLAWITDGEPDEWGTFFWAFAGIETFCFPDRNVTGFLLDLLSLNSPLFPSVFNLDDFSTENRRVTAVY
jgi:hypothetical protein